jgi:hypothetical protein
VALATCVHSAPGVYAMLVGSGMSSAAGIRTGWQVVEDLIRKVAVAEDVDLAALGQTPEEWWAIDGRPEPRYDTLLPALASTDAARQTLLREYFDPPPERGGPILPTAGHQALAQLCASGRVRVILTTNFDRLIERALEQAGVAPQVITSPEQAKGMTPLMHAPVTVVKLHGDYSMLGHGLRNTPEELSSYPEEWTRLLARVFDEFGLIVVGWSADYDTALYHTLAASPSRRYPVFWASYNGNLTESATRLIAQRRATMIDTSGAEEFLRDLVERLGRLDRIAARQNRPVRVEYRHHPSQVPAQGWTDLPLLALRIVGLVGPVFVGQYDDIGPEQREKLVANLGIAAFTNQLRGVAGAKPVYASSGSPGPTLLLGGWTPTAGHQSGAHACYSFGTDGSSGVSAEARVELPNHHTGGSAVIMVDVGLSLENPLYLFELATILRDGLVATSGSLADSITDILPVEADVTGVELHVWAPKHDGDRNARENSLEERVQLSPLGEQTRSLSESLGTALQLHGALVERDAAEIVVETIKHWAIASGYLDPRIGLAQLRAQLGLIKSTPATDQT